MTDRVRLGPTEKLCYQLLAAPSHWGIVIEAPLLQLATVSQPDSVLSEYRNNMIRSIREFVRENGVELQSYGGKLCEANEDAWYARVRFVVEFVDDVRHSLESATCAPLETKLEQLCGRLTDGLPLEADHFIALIGLECHTQRAQLAA